MQRFKNWFSNSLVILSYINILNLTGPSLLLNVLVLFGSLKGRTDAIFGFFRWNRRSIWVGIAHSIFAACFGSGRSGHFSSRPNSTKSTQQPDAKIILRFLMQFRSTVVLIHTYLYCTRNKSVFPILIKRWEGILPITSHVFVCYQ